MIPHLAFCCVGCAGLTRAEISLPLPPECRNQKCVSPHSTYGMDFTVASVAHLRPRGGEDLLKSYLLKINSNVVRYFPVRALRKGKTHVRMISLPPSMAFLFPRELSSAWQVCQGLRNSLFWKTQHSFPWGPSNTLSRSREH